MIGESNAVGKPIPPHFQFKTSAQTPDANHFVSSVSVTCSMCNRRSVTKRFQSFPISLGLYNKGGMDDVKFFEYLQKSIMKLYPDATPVKGKWVVIKCDSGPGRLNPDLLVYLHYHGFYFTPVSPTRLRYCGRQTKVLVRLSQPSEQIYNSSSTSKYVKMRLGLYRRGLLALWSLADAIRKQG